MATSAFVEPDCRLRACRERRNSCLWQTVNDTELIVLYIFCWPDIAWLAIAPRGRTVTAAQPPD
jgi:hypothetical protein